MKPSTKNDRKMLAALSASFPRAAGHKVSAATLRFRFKTGSPDWTVLMSSSALFIPGMVRMDEVSQVQWAVLSGATRNERNLSNVKAALLRFQGLAEVEFE
jgi:hypothetical protein